MRDLSPFVIVMEPISSLRPVQDPPITMKYQHAPGIGQPRFGGHRDSELAVAVAGFAVAGFADAGPGRAVWYWVRFRAARRGLGSTSATCPRSRVINGRRLFGVFPSLQVR